MLQRDILLAELKDGRTVSNLTAVHMNIGNIQDVIMQLRERGHLVDTIADTDALGRNFTKYKLAAGNFVR